MAFILVLYWELYLYGKPTTVAALSKARTVFACSNTGIVGSNPTQSMGVCIVCSCSVSRKRPCDGLIPRPRSPTDCVYRIKKPKKRPRPNEEL
jgi:hypothetical protein